MLYLLLVLIVILQAMQLSVLGWCVWRLRRREQDLTKAYYQGFRDLARRMYGGPHSLSRPA